VPVSMRSLGRTSTWRQARTSGILRSGPRPPSARGMLAQATDNDQIKVVRTCDAGEIARTSVLSTRNAGRARSKARISVGQTNVKSSG
jgi:hypothetical protein